MEEKERAIESSSAVVLRYLSQLEGKLPQNTHYPKKKVSWQELAGDALAKGSFIQSMEEGQVMVACKHSTYLQMLQMHKTKLVKELQASYPTLQIMGIKGFIKSNWPSQTEAVVKEVEPSISQEDNEFRAMLRRLKEQGSQR
jgi:Dna[CI] antecedent, DciA